MIELFIEVVLIDDNGFPYRDEFTFEKKFETLEACKKQANKDFSIIWLDTESMISFKVSCIEVYDSDKKKQKQKRRSRNLDKIKQY